VFFYIIQKSEKQLYVDKVALEWAIEFFILVMEQDQKLIEPYVEKLLFDAVIPVMMLANEEITSSDCRNLQEKLANKKVSPKTKMLRLVKLICT
jgi:hypothetical protein